MSRVKIVDTTLRDGHQCLWATRMTTAMMLPVAETIDRIGFDVVEVMGAELRECWRGWRGSSNAQSGRLAGRGVGEKGSLRRG